MTKKIRVLIVDDSPLCREALKDAIGSETEGIVVVGEAADGLQAVQQATDLKPDVITMT